jgi:hypothetical protein
MKKTCGFLPLLLLASLWGQDQAPEQNPPPAQPPTQTTGKTKDKSKEPSGTSKDRLFFTLPNFLTLENAANVPPLTAAQKFGVTARSSFDPVEFLWYGAISGISQAENSEAGYGQGASGYAKRFASEFADGTIENFIAQAMLPSLLHQDPRYFQLGHGGFWRRTGYAVKRAFVTRTDSGHNQFNYSEVFGAAVAAGISINYHPSGERNLGNALSIWGSQIGYDTLGFVAKEFWPDIRRKLLHKSAPSREQP